MPWTSLSGDLKRLLVISVVQTDALIAAADKDRPTLHAQAG